MDPVLAPSKPDVVIAGDVCIDWFAVPVSAITSAAAVSDERPPNWRLRDGVRMFAQPGGAWLLATLAEQLTGLPIAGQIVPSPLEHQGCDAAIHSMVDLSAFPRSTADKDRKDPRTFVWRVERFRGFAGPASDAKPPRPTPIARDNAAARIVVLDDVGNGFRDSPDRWPQALLRETDGPLVLWKLSRPLTGGALAAHLLHRHKARTIVVMDVDDLRAEGAAISRRLSWERTAGDVIRTLMHDRSFASFREMAHVIVRLDLEGALHFTDLATDEPKVALTYMPAGIEGSTRAFLPGQMLGIGATLGAMLVQALVRAEPGTLSERLRMGIESGIAAAGRLFAGGFGNASKDGESQAPTPLTSHLLADLKTKGVVETVDVAPLAGRDPASRLIDYVRDLPLEQLAEKIVSQGVQEVIPKAPIARFGDLETLDRSETETYRGIRNLISEYLAQPKPERPLSIAVFGPPGSGKSFGVAQVAKSLGNVEKIDFNVTQFESAAGLTGAFHVVRDAAVRGSVPLVFFDEFDAEADGQKLAWLKHFLAPMQDGKFTDGGSVHLIGRAIFVFAGGTSHSLAAFARLTDAEFIAAKGPDFVSRLRGFVDVRGTDRREADDTLYVVRRATLLRSMLKRKAPALFDVAGTLRMDAGVRRAFLRCDSFVHGARSMESIIDMSQLAGRQTFERACLPSEQQLGLHVDSAEFMGLVTQDVRFGELREQLGRAIHERFRVEQAGKKPAVDPAMQPWERLDEMYKEENRKQADDIPAKLARIKWGLQPARQQPTTQVVPMTDDEIERLAVDEHERWNDSKRAQGYRYAPGLKDPEAKTHPCLLPWSDLPEYERDKDRTTVRAIPEFLQSIGFRAFRLT